MSPKDKKLIMISVVVCLVIAILSPFIASSNPDGLEKTSEQVGGSESGIYEAPFPDYTVTALGDGPFSGIIALALGVFIALILGYIAAMIIRRRNPPETSK